MGTVQEIQEAVSHLSREDLARFRAWFEEFDAKLWDTHFEQDAESGKLDELAEKALADFGASKHKEP